MRCFGRTSSSFKKCKNNCKFIYCDKHKLQWWAIVGVFATLLGSFQDLAPPFFPENKNTELISIIKIRKANVDTLVSYINTDLSKKIKEDR